MTSGAGSESYNYDDVGNRTSSHRSASYNYQPNQFNRVSATASANYNYDANGNMVSKTVGANTTQYIWDYENRLKQVILPSGQNVVYKYDALGRRSERNVNNSASWTKFIYDGQDVILDQNSDGTSITYLNGLGIDNKIRQTVNGQAQYFLQDHLGSTNALTDATGNVIASTNYDSFGNATNASFPTRYQFTGREYDSLTGLQYSRARWYDGNLGRFISEDPIGFLGGDVNLYGYVRNNPLNFKDPKGTIVAGLIVGGVIIAEAGFHWYLMTKAFEEFPDELGLPPQDRQRHCWVNCASTRLHLLITGNPLLAAVGPSMASLGKETRDFVAYGLGYDDSHQSWGELVIDSTNDMAANIYGQLSAYVFWKSCKENCKECPSKR
jgi:RHS repeat-associated protein